MGVSTSPNEVIEKLDVSSGCDVTQHLHGVIFATPAGGTGVLDPFMIGVVDIDALVEYPIQNFLRVCIVSVTSLGNMYEFLFEILTGGSRGLYT